MPVMLTKTDLEATVNQQLETLRREHKEEVESEKRADGTLKCGPASERRWENNIHKYFLGFSLHPTLGSFDADYFLVNNNPEWAQQHRIYQDGYSLRVEKQEGRFPEHEVVWGVPLSRLSDFIEEKQDKIAVASRWLLWRASKAGLIAI